MKTMSLLIGAASLGAAAAVQAEVAKPAALTAQNIPPISDALVAATRPYLEYRTAGFASWNPRDRSMTIATRFANTTQLHTVAAPMGARRQISFEAEPVNGQWSPTGDSAGGSSFIAFDTASARRRTRSTLPPASLAKSRSDQPRRISSANSCG